MISIFHHFKTNLNKFIKNKPLIGKMKEKIIATVVNTFLYEDPSKDFENVKKTISKNKDSDIIVFSEVCLSNFKNELELNKIIKELTKISIKENIIIIIGVDNKTTNKKYNSAYLFEDENVNIYNKVHLVYEEVNNYQNGEEFPVFETKIGKIGMMICYDAIFPESARCLKLNGAEIICLLAQWTKDEDEYWDIVTRVRAKENWVFLLASDDINKGCGKSRIIGPNGKILGITKKEPYNSITIKLDMKKLKKINNSPDNVNWKKIRQPKKYKIINE